MKAIKLTVLALLLASTTACVVYDPAPYPYPSRRVIVERESGPDGSVYEYATPAYPASAAVVVNPFWLFGPWCFDGYYYGHSGYYGHGGGYRGGGYHGGGGGYHGGGGGNHGGGGGNHGGGGGNHGGGGGNHGGGGGGRHR